jgi:hypothetical protein
MSLPDKSHNWQIAFLMDEQRIIRCMDCGCEALINSANSHVQCYRDKDGRWMFPDEDAPVCGAPKATASALEALGAPYKDTPQPADLYAAVAAAIFTPEECLTAQRDLQKKFDDGNAEILALGGSAVKTVVGPVAPDGSCECTNEITLPPIKMLDIPVEQLTCIRCGYEFLGRKLGAICPSCGDI